MWSPTIIVKHSLHGFLLAFYLYLYLPTIALANFTLPQETLEIQSDTLALDQNTQQAIHEGNVIVQQGTHTLLADKLILYKNNEKNQPIEKMIAKGTPANFEATHKNGKGPLFGTANTIYYYPTTQKLILEGDATLEYQQDIFKAPQITYDMQKNTIFSEKTTAGRSTMIIHPPQKPKQAAK